MEKPQVKIIEPQRLESEREITGYEAEELLKKYGYSEQYSSIPNRTSKEKKLDLTFEQMIELEEKRLKEEKEKKYQKQRTNKPISFNGQNGYDTKVTYKTDEELGFSFKIQISSDMKLPKY